VPAARTPSPVARPPRRGVRCKLVPGRGRDPRRQRARPGARRRRRPIPGRPCLAPRVRKESLHLAGWVRDAAPSTELRRWFGHEPARWPEFRRRYVAELDARPEAWAPLRAAAGDGDVVLLYSAHDRERNNAVVLRDYLEERLQEDR
jgi:uncharacterized protein YeaO (DUF488 family)